MFYVYGFGQTSLLGRKREGVTSGAKERKSSFESSDQSIDGCRLDSSRKVSLIEYEPRKTGRSNICDYNTLNGVLALILIT